MKNILLSMTAAVAAIAMAPAANAAQTITITGSSGFFGDDSVQAGTSTVSTTGFPGVQTGTGAGTTGGAGSFTRIFNFFTPQGFNLASLLPPGAMAQLAATSSGGQTCKYAPTRP